MLSDYESCTSGFSMYNSASPSTRYTLTVAHCVGYVDMSEVTNRVRLPMGRSEFVWELYGSSYTGVYDLGAVDLNDGFTNQPYIYLAEDHLTGRIAVAGYASGGIPAGGNYCIHGRYPETVNCNLLSGGTNRSCQIWPPYGLRCVYTINISAYNPRPLIRCPGDSGAPIYYWSGDAVIAAGLASWGNSDAGHCDLTGGASVVATAVHLIPGLRVVTTSQP